MNSYDKDDTYIVFFLPDNVEMKIHSLFCFLCNGAAAFQAAPIEKSHYCYGGLKHPIYKGMKFTKQNIND